MTKPQTVKTKTDGDDSPVIPPPASMEVADKRVILYNAAGKPLVRKVGF